MHAYMYRELATVLLKNNVANTRNFNVSNECVAVIATIALLFKKLYS